MVSLSCSLYAALIWAGDQDDTHRDLQFVTPNVWLVASKQGLNYVPSIRDIFALRDGWSRFLRSTCINESRCIGPETRLLALITAGQINLGRIILLVRKLVWKVVRSRTFRSAFDLH